MLVYLAVFFNYFLYFQLTYFFTDNCSLQDKVRLGCRQLFAFKWLVIAWMDGDMSFNIFSFQFFLVHLPRLDRLPASRGCDPSRRLERTSTS